MVTKRHSMVSMLVRLVAVLVVVFLIPGEPFGQTDAEPTAPPSVEIVIDPLSDVGTILIALSTLSEPGYAVAEPSLEALSLHDDPVVRASLCRLLAARPELEPRGVLIQLANDADSRVSLLALIALSRSGNPDAIQTLESSLEAISAQYREFGSVALFLRDTFATEEDLVTPSEDVLAQARSHIASGEARSWLAAMDHYEHLQDSLSAWLSLHDRLLNIEQLEGHIGECAQRVRQNPSLLMPERTVDGVLTESTAITRPFLSHIAPSTDRPIVLLTTGRHDDLANRAFEQQDRTGMLERYVERIEMVCRFLPAEETHPTLIDPGPYRHYRDEIDGWVGIGLGIINQPFAFRDGAPDFIVGEDIEFALTPTFSLSYVDALATQVLPSEQRSELNFVDGVGVELVLGGTISSAFFDDRSRPSGSLMALVDELTERTSEHAVDGMRYAFQGQFSPGLADAFTEPTVYPAPHLSVSNGLEYLYYEGGDGRYYLNRHAGLDVVHVEYLFDDATSRPRDRRWIDLHTYGAWVFGEASDWAQVGLRGYAEGRTSREMVELMAAAGGLSPSFVWRDSQLEFTLWAGVGAGWADVEGGSIYATPIFGGSARVNDRFDELSLSFEVAFSHEVRNLGRSGYTGVIERGEAQIGLSFTETMREMVRFMVFYDRTDPEDTGAQLGVGGFELSVPVGLVELDQEISYQMRHVIVIDEARFGASSQALFEGIISAGTRF